MQSYVLILTTLWLAGRDTVRLTTTSMQEFTNLQNCVTAGEQARNLIVNQAKYDGVYYPPRVKAVCLPK